VTDATHEARDDQLAVSAREGSVSVGHATVAGLRQPIVAVLLLIAFFTTISGKPLDGFLMLTVATLLVWDAARSLMGASAAAGRRDVAARPADSSSKKALKGLGWLTGGGLYAGIVGSFSRYSWPATIAVVALGCLMVAVGWQGPLRHRQAPGARSLRRAWLWAVVLVTGGLWELSSLLQQPHLTTDSYAHPTISALTDPLLVSHPGRSVALGAWLLIGWFLVGR